MIKIIRANATHFEIIRLVYKHTLLKETTCHYHVIVVHISFLGKGGKLNAIFC